jgi:hypothetical protein
MKKRMLAAICMTASLALFPTLTFSADQMTPAQLADARVKAETAHRLVVLGREMKDANMLLSAAKLMEAVGPVADPAQGMKEGKPVAYDVKGLLDEAGALGADSKSVEALKASMPTTQNECTLFYNCTSDNSVCWWDHWC